ncbi:MAG: hypothetical protein RL104_1074 [Bacteroidota bacterium]
MIHGPYLVLAVLAAYFLLLVLVAEWATRRSGADNTQFFTAGRQSPWWLVSFGMIGASLSGVTFVSVPGWVGTSSFSYLQMVLGYVAGYAVVALVLLPLYYRTATTTIYGYLDQRFGLLAYRTGAWLFIVSRWVGSSLRLFLVAAILHDLVAQPFGLPFGATVVGVLGLIWLYTHRGGIRAVVFTDTLQTAAMLGVLVWVLAVLLGDLGVAEPWTWLWEQPESQWFFPEATDGRNFWKQFLGGMFITITMTGLDQDMMQKNLTCRSLKEAQLNMGVFSLVLVAVNLLFLALGIVLYRYAEGAGIDVVGDGLFAAVALSPEMPVAVLLQRRLGLDGVDHVLFGRHTRSRGNGCGPGGAPAAPRARGHDGRRRTAHGRRETFCGPKHHHHHFHRGRLHLRTSAWTLCPRAAHLTAPGRLVDSGGMRARPRPYLRRKLGRPPMVGVPVRL